MKIMTYNILEGGVGRIDPLAEVIRLANADVVVVQDACDEAAFHKLADRVKMDRFLAGAVGLLSRLEIREAANHGVLRAIVRDRNKTELGVIGVHLPSKLSAIFEIARTFTRISHMLAGDFSASHPEQIVRNGYHAPESLEPSFPTSKPTLRADYIFVTPELAPAVKSCEVFKPEIGRFTSDHFPVIADLNI
ncbi:MAG: endonuclease/exonuclease/phosphatase family protein [Phycisphaerales bacterium]|nr:endonuclease/exonuclease/phosphatase family protein [Phycisphaerales bacterium]